MNYLILIILWAGYCALHSFLISTWFINFPIIEEVLCFLQIVLRGVFFGVTCHFNQLLSSITWKYYCRICLPLEYYSNCTDERCIIIVLLGIFLQL